MKVRRSEGSTERKILTAMILDDTVLATIASRFEKGLFKNKWSQIVAGWCVKYYEKKGKPPGRTIEALYEDWAEKHEEDNPDKRLMEQLLESLSDEYDGDRIDSSAVLERAKKYFNEVRLRREIEEMQDLIDNGEIEAAEQVRAKSSIIQLADTKVGIDPFEDEDAIREAFEEAHEPVITFYGNMKKFLGTSFRRGGFISFMGPEKRGKSFWLMDIAWRALLQRRRVAYFDAGDNPMRDVLLRLGSKAAKRPIEPGKIRIPNMFTRGEGKNKPIQIAHKDKYFEHPLSWQEAMDALRKVKKIKIKTKKSMFKIQDYASGLFSVADLEAVLKQWKSHEGFVPDVIVIDYADLLAAPKGVNEYRHQVNEIWMGLRGLAKTYDCLIVTATQSDSKSYGVDIITRKHFSEDKRKLAHVTGMIGLNQTLAEEDKGITRINWIVRRGARFNERKCLHVAGCLGIGDPAIRSAF